MNIFRAPFSDDLRHSRLAASPISRAARTAPALVAMATVGLFTAKSLGDVQALVGEENGNLKRLDITTGSSTTLSNIGTDVYGLAYNATETTLYGITSISPAAPSSLVSINQNTGASTTIGTNIGATLGTFTNLADGQLFGVDFNGNLFQVNPSSGAASLIGYTGLNADSVDNSLASNGTTLYYTFSVGAGVSSLYTLNLSTGAATLVGSTGVDAIVGSAFAGPTYDTGSLYGFSAAGEAYLINLTTGAATPVSDDGLDDIFGGVGIITAAPEPASALLVLAGVVGIVGTRRRARSRE